MKNIATFLSLFSQIVASTSKDIFLDPIYFSFAAAAAIFLPNFTIFLPIFGTGIWEKNSFDQGPLPPPWIRHYAQCNVRNRTQTIFI